MVASGGNIAAVAGFVLLLAKRLGPMTKIPLILATVWGYALLAGSGIPIIRAALMASLAIIAEPWLKTDALSALFLV